MSRALTIAVLISSLDYVQHTLGRLVEQRFLVASKTGARPARLPCDAPVQKKRVEFPDHLVLANDASGLHMYSGYVNVSSQDYLFYWFVEAAPEAGADAPILVWSNGGPGCSAMEGATTEIGPLMLYGAKVSESSFTGKLVRNPYSWHKRAHLLFVDQPRYVGYSCGTGPYVTSSKDAGVDMVAFLRGWRALYPERSSTGFVLASESYGGHYVPAWTAAILDHNAASSETLPLVGLALGNAMVNRVLQDGAAFVEFAKVQGLISKGTVRDLLYDPRTLIRQNLGYEPNYYDYRRESRFCCGCFSYNYSTWSHWLLRDDVQAALHVCGNAGVQAFGDCHGGCIEFPDGFDTRDSFDYLGAIGRALNQGISVSFYYGMQDTACDYIGGYAMASKIRWAGAERFAAAPLNDLVLGGAVAGRTKSVGGLTWTEIEGAGHMTPIDNPAAAFFALEALLGKVETFASTSCRGLVDGEMMSASGHLLGGALLGFLGTSLIGLAVYCTSRTSSRRTRSGKMTSSGLADIHAVAPMEEMALIAAPSAAATQALSAVSVPQVRAVPNPYVVTAPSAPMSRLLAHPQAPLSIPLRAKTPVAASSANVALDWRK